MSSLCSAASINVLHRSLRRSGEKNMVDSRGWSKVFVTEFINLYKRNACLWQRNIKEYKNKKLRVKAYEKLVAFCKPVFPEADQDFVVKKIRSMRKTFRKEHNKVMESKRSGRVYIPTLWYYPLFLFLLSQNEARMAQSLSNLPTQNALNFQVKQEQPDEPTNEEVDYSEEDSQDSESVIVFDDEEEEQETLNHSQSREISVTSISEGRKRKRSSLQENENDLSKANGTPLADSTWQRHDLDEFEATGITVTKKLRRMDAFQAICAEFLINAVLKRGLLKTLLPNTVLCDNQCNRR